MSTVIRSGLQAYFTSDDLSITHLEAACERETQAGDHPKALGAEMNIGIYSAERLAPLLEHKEHE